MKVIIINGQGGSGKDTFVNFCQQNNSEIWNISTIDCVKKMAYRVGWDGQKDNKGRRLLSDLKDALTAYGDIPFNSVLDGVYAIKHNYKVVNKSDENVVIFIHCREPEEIERLKKTLNGITLLIRRPTVSDTFTNHADKNVFDYDYDYVYDNVGDLEKLKDDATSFIDFIKRK